ncbi:MAG: NUDIX hydrolase [Lachnospiraceae bacterium]|nr:NUDIX hydrolase [Lachnospiraceae bacterium]
MKKPDITENHIHSMQETKFVNMFDIQYQEGKHYYDVTRRAKKVMVALKTDEEFLNLEPDASNCIVIVRTPGEEPRLVLFYEFRYPTGRFLLSPPAGLIDPEDKGKKDATLITAAREIHEETGIVVKPTDRLFEVSPLVFSTPGLTDECNALVCAVVDLDDLSSLTQKGAEGSECFNGFCLLNKEQAEEVLRTGRDEYGNFYSVYTWMALIYFVTGMWEE